MTAGRGTPWRWGYCEEQSYAHDVPLLEYSVRTEKGKTMGAHGCDHNCGTCGKCTAKSCPNRVKCKGHK